MIDLKKGYKIPLVLYDEAKRKFFLNLSLIEVIALFN